MAHRHHDPVLAPCLSDKAIRQIGHGKAVVKRRIERGSKPCQQRTIVVANGRDLAVHRRSAFDHRPARQAKGLMAKADPKQWPEPRNACRGKGNRDPGSLRHARSRRNDDPIASCFKRLRDVDPVVSFDDYFGASDPQVVSQHEGETVDIVEQEQARCGHVKSARTALTGGANQPRTRRRNRFFVALDANILAHRGEKLLGEFL